MSRSRSGRPPPAGWSLQYLTAGHGPAIVLLHGYAETSLMWRPLIPQLAARFTVIAPDLPGIGGSGVPADGLDMAQSAVRIHDLVKSLGVAKAAVVGHDIGLMVAYAYAAKFPAETEKLVMMDAFLPGVDGWEAIYNNPAIWHFRFNGPTPEALVEGRERTYFEHYWNDFAADKTRSIPEAARQAYTAAYARPGRMRAAWAYFVSFPQTAKVFAQFSQTKLTMPLLTIGGDKANGTVLAKWLRSSRRIRRPSSCQIRALADGGKSEGDHRATRFLSLMATTHRTYRASTIGSQVATGGCPRPCVGSATLHGRELAGSCRRARAERACSDGRGRAA